MDPRRRLDVAILIAATALTRIAFRSHYLYDIDSVNFALALKRFDPAAHQPQPPGYFLYVCLGRLAGLLSQDANTAFVAISVVFSCGVVAMVYVFAADWFGRRSALFAGAIVVFSPLVWFHGIVALTYVVEAFFSALVGYLCWHVFSEKTRCILPAAMVLGVAAGFRPSTLLLLAPLLLFSLRTAGRKQVAIGIATLALTLLAWGVPMVWISGGHAYLSSLVSLWLAVPSKEMAFNSSLANSFARAVTIMGIYFLCFGCAALLPLSGLRRSLSRDRRKAIFTAVWLTPGLLFFTFVYLKFVNSGYLLLLVPPVCLWMGTWASVWYQNIRLSSASKLLFLGGCAAVNTAVFIAAPVYCSYSQVRRFEAELASIIVALPQMASPQEALIVGFDSHFLGYRHAGYYLPAYTTVQFPEVQLAAGPRTFTMQHRDTQLKSGVIATTCMKSFILFPLPSGDREYRDYIAHLRSRFPAGDLRTVLRDRHEFVIGPIADLRLLFSEDGRQTGGGKSEKQGSARVGNPLATSR